MRIISTFFFFLLTFNIAFSESSSDDFDCIKDFHIIQHDCKLALYGQLPCGGSYYDVMYATVPTGPFVKVGTHTTSSIYTVDKTGYYKLKVKCGYTCHESNTLHFDYSCGETCNYNLYAPFSDKSTIFHCFSKDGPLVYNAAAWLTGCSDITYSWATPSGIVDDPVLYGNHGYGTYWLVASCHSTDCYGEVKSISFDLKEKCENHSYCDFKVTSPISTKEHCYDTQGDLWLSASSWVTGCTDATYKWVTPIGSVNGPILEGNYGYGIFKLKVICHTSTCYYEEEVVSFLLKKSCTSHCYFNVNSPITTKEHCYESNGNLWLNASSWVDGCQQATYKWHTPAGVVTGPILEGNYGYGLFTLKVLCHSSNCYYEEEVASFTLKDACVEHCHLKIKSPLSDRIKHCFESDGIIWLDAKSWVNGCHNVHYKWTTPTGGSIHSSTLDGKYGYGKYTLTVTCHDASCYYETASTSFTLEDDCVKYKPYDIYCPETKRVDCDAELWNLNTYGRPYYIHHGSKVWMNDDKVHRHMNECNRGYITREWKFKDPHGFWHTCSQDIHVGETSYGEAAIDWPKTTLEIEGCNPSIKPEDLPYGYRKPYYENSDCANLGRSYSDQEFYYNSTCKKIVRKWTVIDWCLYNPNNDPNKGKYVKHQTIKIISDESPIVKYENHITTSTANCENVKVELDDLKVTAESCGDYFIITNDSPYASQSKANASGNYPIGTTEVLYTVQYGCGYKKNYLQKITVENTGDLVAYCEGKIVLPLAGIDSDNDGINDKGETTVWAKDFDLGSYDLCAGEINHSFSPDSIVMNRTFTCEEIGRNELRVYISDNKGNQTYCTVEVDIQNNAANIKDCEPSDEVETDVDYEESSEDNADEENSEDEESDAASEEAEDAEEDTYSDESTQEDVTEDENDDHAVAEDNIAKASGLVSTYYGEVIQDVELNLYKMEMSLNDESTFEIVNVVVDSFYSRSGALLYVTEKDTIYNTEVAVENESPQMVSTAETNKEGLYKFNDLTMADSYMIEPSETDMQESHVTIDDANRLYAHLSGADPLTDPYALLAADVNQSGSLDFSDLDLLLSYINDESNEIAEYQMLFVDAGYEFKNVLDPWNEDYLTHRHIAELDDTEYTADFIAVTIGDIVPTETSDELRRTDIRTRTELSVTPNPFYRGTTIRFNNPTTQIGTLTIYTIDGQRTHQSKIRLLEGMEHISITDDMLPHTGIYIYTLNLGEISHRGRLLKIN